MNIDVYLNVCFWFYITVISCKVLVITCAEYPRKTTHSIGEDLISFLLTISFFVWVCLLQAKIL